MITDSSKKEKTSHDKIFKKLLEWYLPEFLRLFFPEKAAHLDLSTLRFLKQELILPLPDQMRRITDIVAEVHTLAGNPEIILVHVEVEANQPQPLPYRMFEYYVMLRLLERLPVLPLAMVLTPNVGGISQQSYRESLFGQEIMKFSYNQVGLFDLARDDYFDPSNPLAATLSALMQSKAVGEGKLASMQSIFDHPGLTQERRLFLMKLIDTYLPNEKIPDLGDETMTVLKAFEGHWIEKVRRESWQEGRQEGQQEGRQEGQQEGRQELLLHLLTLKFGTLPDDFVARLYAITDTAVLDKVSEQVLTAVSLTDIQFPEPNN